MPKYRIKIQRDVVVYGYMEIEAQNPEDASSLTQKSLENIRDLESTYNTIDRFEWEDGYIDDYVRVYNEENMSENADVSNWARVTDEKGVVYYDDEATAT